MFLSAAAIERAMADRRITITPFDPARLGAASYTFGVGDEVFEVAPERTDTGYTFAPRPAPLQNGAWLLAPGRLYLAATQERMGSAHFAMRLVGRPGLGHIGLFLQVSADLGHQGALHAWTLEIVATNPTRLHPGQLIGQIGFCRTAGPARPYEGDFGASDRPMMSSLHGRRAL